MPEVDQVDQADQIDEVVRIVQELLAALDAPPSGAELRSCVAEHVRMVDPLADERRSGAVVDAVCARLVGLGPLEPLLDDEAVTDVLVNGDGEVWVERRGRLERTDLELDREVRLGLIERVVNPLGLRADTARPIVDARLADGSRVNAVLAPLSVDGPCLSIRRFATAGHPVEAYCTDATAELLRAAIDHRMNVLISGGTGAGKTAFLNALCSWLPPTDRIVTIEDAAELRLPGEHVVRLEARPANAEGVGEVSVRELVRTALRMRPDRIVVGEVRGPEALDMLQAMNTGHEGSMSTCHANSPEDALRRIETMVLLGGPGLSANGVREQILASLDLVVQVGRVPESDRRRVVAVDEVAVLEHASEVILETRSMIGHNGDAPGARRSSRLVADGRERWW